MWHFFLVFFWGNIHKCKLFYLLSLHCDASVPNRHRHVYVCVSSTHTAQHTANIFVIVSNARNFVWKTQIFFVFVSVSNCVKIWNSRPTRTNEMDEYNWRASRCSHFNWEWESNRSVRVRDCNECEVGCVFRKAERRQFINLITFDEDRGGRAHVQVSSIDWDYVKRMSFRQFYWFF